MQQYQLAEIYSNLRRATVAGRQAEATRWLGAVLDLDLPPLAADAPWNRPARRRVTLAPLLTYRGFKPAELAMLADGRKPVVKFEDIPLDLAARFTARHAHRYQIETSAPYHKDYLLLRSRPARAAGPDALVALYVSRDDTAARLRRLEQTDREDSIGSGTLLGYPPCCIAAFGEDFARSRQDQDTLNDDACRRLLTGCTPGEPMLNPLNDLELLGFYACRLDCPHALAIARRNAAALLRTRPALQPRLRVALGRSILYWRLPFFAAIDGAWQDGALRFTGLQVNAVADPVVRTIQSLFARHLEALLATGDRLLPTARGVELLSGDRPIAMVSAAFSSSSPILARWRDDAESFFDPQAAPEQPREHDT